MRLTEQNETVVRRLYHEASIHMLSCCERPNYRYYVISDKQCCLDGFAQFFADVSKSFSNSHLTIKRLETKDDKVMVHYTVYGTQKGDFMGIPATGDSMAVSGIDVFRLNEGKVVEHWDAARQLAALQLAR